MYNCDVLKNCQKVDKYMDYNFKRKCIAKFFKKIAQSGQSPVFSNKNKKFQQKNLRNHLVTGTEIRTHNLLNMTARPGLIGTFGGRLVLISVCCMKH